MKTPSSWPGSEEIKLITDLQDLRSSFYEILIKSNKLWANCPEKLRNIYNNIQSIIDDCSSKISELMLKNNIEDLIKKDWKWGSILALREITSGEKPKYTVTINGIVDAISSAKVFKEIIDHTKWYDIDLDLASVQSIDLDALVILKNWNLKLIESSNTISLVWVNENIRRNVNCALTGKFDS